MASSYFYTILCIISIPLYRRRTLDWEWTCCLLYTSLVLLLVGLKTPFAYLSVYLLTNALYAVYQPIYYNDLQAYLPSSVRATMLSINSMMFSLSMIVIFPLTGWFIDSCGFVAVFIVLGLITLFSFPLLMFGLGKMGKILSKVTKKE